MVGGKLICGDLHEGGGGVPLTRWVIRPVYLGQSGGNAQTIEIP